MSLYPKSANILIEQLAKLPGIGKATAQRLAFFILKSDQQDNINDILAETFGPGVSFKVQKNTINEVESAEIKTIDNETNHERDEQVRDKIVDLFDGEILT